MERESLDFNVLSTAQSAEKRDRQTDRQRERERELEVIKFIGVLSPVNH